MQDRSSPIMLTHVSWCSRRVEPLALGSIFIVEQLHCVVVHLCEPGKYTDLCLASCWASAFKTAWNHACKLIYLKTSAQGWFWTKFCSVRLRLWMGKSWLCEIGVSRRAVTLGVWQPTLADGLERFWWRRLELLHGHSPPGWSANCLWLVPYRLHEFLEEIFARRCSLVSHPRPLSALLFPILVSRQFAFSHFWFLFPRFSQKW